MATHHVLIVLGSPNHPDGELSEIAKSRLDFAAKHFVEGDRILCTGGWGDHFNCAPQAHADYAKGYLLKKGIPEQAFLENALSANTVEDAVKSKIILSELNRPLLTVITSDFHMERVQLIFNEILRDYTIQYIKVSSDFLNSVQRTKLIEHERKAIQIITQRGLLY